MGDKHRMASVDPAVLFIKQREAERLGVPAGPVGEFGQDAPENVGEGPQEFTMDDLDSTARGRLKRYGMADFRGGDVMANRRDDEDGGKGGGKGKGKGKDKGKGKGKGKGKDGDGDDGGDDAGGDFGDSDDEQGFVEGDVDYVPAAGKHKEPPQASS